MNTYINPKINQSNFEDYFNVISIKGDGNCGIYSIIYAIKHCTNISTFNNYKELKENGNIYYEKTAVDFFRKDIADIYDERINITKNKSTKDKYEKRKKEILKEREWLNDDDINLYGQKYELCIYGFQFNPFRNEFISSGKFDWNGFAECPNTIFILNRGGNVDVKQDTKKMHESSSTGIHFEALVPKDDAKICKKGTFDDKTGNIIYDSSKPFSIDYIRNSTFSQDNELNESIELPSPSINPRRTRKSAPSEQPSTKPVSKNNSTKKNNLQIKNNSQSNPKSNHIVFGGLVLVGIGVGVLVAIT